MLAPYIVELGRNVSAFGVPTLRPLWYEFPSDSMAWTREVEDQFMLGPRYLAAPVTQRGATARNVYFPGGDGVLWREVEAVGGRSGIVHAGGQRENISAPIGTLPLFERVQ